MLRSVTLCQGGVQFFVFTFAMAALSDLGALTSMLQESEELAASRQEEAAASGGALTKSVVKLPGAQDQAQENKDLKGNPALIEDVTDPNAIWTEAEVDERDPDFEDDGRPAPEYDILYKQNVGAGDVYLGLGGKTPSTVDCNFMVVKIDLPGEKLKDIDLRVEAQKIVVQSPKFKLATYLPFKVKDDEGKAKWLSEKDVLQITLPIIRDGW